MQLHRVHSYIVFGSQLIFNVIVTIFNKRIFFEQTNLIES